MFVDTLNMPTIRKKILKLEKQDPGESMRRWQCVTKSLMDGDVEAATEAKHEVRQTPVRLLAHPSLVFLCPFHTSSSTDIHLHAQLEEKQRADAKEREEKGIQWEQKVHQSDLVLCIHTVARHKKKVFSLNMPAVAYLETNRKTHMHTHNLFISCL